MQYFKSVDIDVNFEVKITEKFYHVVERTKLFRLFFQNGSTSALGFTHRLESIDKTTSKRSSESLRYRDHMEDWYENELDSMWIAVRRHCKGNWEAISADPSMPLLRNTATKNAIRISNYSTNDEV